MTYSIVARDSETGELGVAIQSRAFRAGGVVPWALPGVGAVATQSFTERSYGPLGLELLRAGKTPGQALAGLVAADPEQAVRQVAIVDAEGRTAAHTGEACIPEAGHRTGEGYSVQADGRGVRGRLRVARKAAARGTRRRRGGRRRLARAAGCGTARGRRCNRGA